MERTNLQKAIAMATKAWQEDEAGSYEEAINSYQQAVKIFLHVVKREPQGKEGNQKIREKCFQYLDRAEKLQEYLEEKQLRLRNLLAEAKTIQRGYNDVESLFHYRIGFY